MCLPVIIFEFVMDKSIVFMKNIKSSLEEQTLKNSIVRKGNSN